MTITTRTLVEDPRLQLDVAVDAGLEREVRWVLTTELSDPARYLHGGEVVLTNGLWLEIGTDPATFVERVKRTSIAAVGFGLGEDGELPPGLAEACREAGLTLLAVPYQLAFVDIVEVFAGHVQAAKQRAMQLAIDLSGEYADASAGTSVLGILDVLSRARSLSVHLLGPGPTIRSTPRDRLAPEEATRIWRLVRGRGRRVLAVDGWTVFPVGVQDELAAFLLVAGPLETMAADVRLSIEQALIFLSRELRYEHHLFEATQRFTNELVDLALAGPGQDEAVRLRLRALQLDPDRPLCVLAARETEPGSDVVLVSQYLQGSQGLACIPASRDGDTLVITQWPEEGSAAAIAEQVVDDLDGGFVLGVGVAVPDSSGLRASLLTSCQALEVAAARTSGPRFACHTDLGSHEILVTLQDPDIVGAFCHAVLGPLEENDRTHHTDLVATLERFLASGCRWQSTADELFVHVNTLRHRLTRVEALTGRDLSSMSDRVDFVVALAARSGSARAG